MDFALSTEQLDLAEAERAWLHKHDPILERRESIDESPARITAAMRKHVAESGLAGLLTIAVGATHVDLLVLAEAHGWAGSALPLAEMAIAARLLEDIGHSSADDAAESTEIVVPVPPAPGLHMRIDGDTLRVTGRSAPITGLIDADRIVVVSQTDDGAEVAAVIRVEAIEVTVLDTLDLLRSWAVVDIDVTLESGDWATLSTGSAAALSEQLATFRAVDALGCADRLLTMAIDYAGQRSQFGQPIGSFQAVKHHLANMALWVEASRSVLWRAALALDGDNPGERAAAVAAAVAYACKSSGDTGQLALQIHGGIGFTWEHDVHLLIRRIKVDELLDGTVADHRRRVVDLHAAG
ncbi:acyl-CoA dehydrogenase [Gordonia sp. HNM0687]|uniref:Acyl-CoA dehydrogenase n=1 Tax=Gordonia mangrovi TaxID=2665643 RepID=A0A6L7GV43_9ACTN|nr:acyl-CoA dehydrogenase family protein [Gordonia mangrovi]MXP23362.1 acyl-CoA dehydrogenase [Gordonia mangrovi]UVF76731.1 acyl-CoA dehydrogenase family protein [Gordonia mangrovi]